jgi:acyl-CoA synthetase (AMP-forming)/AMP-acid ligase II
VAATALLGEGLRISEVSGDRRVPDKFRILLTTSGTTGRPKVASHTLERLAGRVRRSSSLASEARWLLTYSPASFAGLQVILTALLLDGVLIASGEPQITRLVELARKHAVTHVSGTPTFWRSFLVALSEVGGLPSLRYVTLGGEVASQALLDRLHAAFPEARITHIFAATETGALFSVTDGREGFPPLARTGFEGSHSDPGGGSLSEPRRMKDVRNRRGWKRPGLDRQTICG